MGIVITGVNAVVSGVQSASSTETATAFLSHQRNLSDPLFFTSITLDNIIAGSRYRITRHDTAEELSTGVAAGSTETIGSVPCYANPMLVAITVRKASEPPHYKIFDTLAFVGRAGAKSYVLQQPDE